MPHDSTDEVLLRRFVAGQREALGELAQRYELHLLGLARGMLGGRDDLACDAVQETWMRVIRYGASFNGRSSFRTWLYRILINRCRSTRKNEGRRPKSRQADPPQEAGQSPAATASPDEDNRELHAAVAQLAAAKREVLLLCYHADLTHEQAAKILRIPPGTLKSRLHAALEELRKRLATEGRS